jgi:hypothetical protein
MARWAVRRMVTVTVSFRVSTDSARGFRAACRALRKQLTFSDSRIFTEDSYIIDQVGRARAKPGKGSPSIRKLADAE